RDGASAQYGSDAIAGVVNLRLREARKGGNLTAGYSYYDTDIKTARGNRDEVDGTTYTLSGWVGLPLGEDGFVTLSGDYRDRGATSRGDRDPRVTPSVVTSRYGDPKAEDVSLYVNAGLPLANGWTAYGWAGGQKRESESAAFFRVASNSNNVPAIYPNGFLPLITFDSEDYTVAGGTRGELGGWATDLSVVYGRNAIELGVRNSVNPTYGTASPRQFEAGAFIYDQVSVSADFSRQFDVAAFAGPLNVAFGVEARQESYRIKAGEPKSWDRGPITSATPGAQGFPGLQPSNVVDKSRRNFGLYVDVEAEVIEKLTTSVAVRAEDYSDFGNNVSGKLAARYDFTPQFALRGSVASGFRAPSLAQQYYTATSTNFISGVPFETGTFPATSPIARALGAQPLDAETSLNTAIGAVYRNGPFELTLDAYQINIDDRIVLSENLGGRADIDAILAPFGVTRARFFINGVDTETKGADLVARYRFDTGAFGKFDTSLAASVTETEITRLPRTERLSALTPAPDLFARVAQTIITDGTPKSRATATVDWSLGDFGATLKAVNYGKAIEPGSTAASDISTGNKTLVDLEGRYAFGQGTSLTLGASNLFDVYPDRTPAALNSTGTLGFTRYSPFGFNGRQLYVRLSHNW
ncbi:MAG: TonB-dependent receptor plug domain-containing protein, partial [Asticcacaulis sp.]